MNKKLRFAREFSRGVNSTYIVTDLAKNKLNDIHLKLIQNIARFNSLKDCHAIELVGENIVKACYKNGLINKAYFETETFESSLFDVKEYYSEDELATNIFYVLDFGGLSLLEAFDECSWDELIVPKMYLGAYNKYELNSKRYDLFKRMLNKNANFEFTAQPPPVYLFNGILRFHAMMKVRRQTDNDQKLLLGVIFFDDSTFPIEKERAAAITSLEQFFRGETVKKVCASYGMIEKESNMSILAICKKEKQALRIAASASLFHTKNAINKFRFIILDDEKYGINVFENEGHLLRYESGEFKKTYHKFFPK